MTWRRYGVKLRDNQGAVRRRARLGCLLVIVVVAVAVVPAASRSADYRGVPLATVVRVSSGVGVVQPLTCRGQTIRAFQGASLNATGFLVGSRLLMTADHVVSDWFHDRRVYCRYRVWLGGHWYSVTRTTAWAEPSKPDDRRGVDVATFELARPAPGHVFQFAPRAAYVGDTVAALGYPAQLPLSVSQGVVRRVFKDYGIPTMAERIVIEGGNSGGPVINHKGEVVSLVSRVFPVTNPNYDGPNLEGGIDFVRWWGNAIKSDLCRAHSDTGIPHCPGNTTKSLTKTPVEVSPR